MKRFNGSFLLFLISFSYCLIQGSFYPLLVLLFSALHELGHYYIIRKSGGIVDRPRGRSQGFLIKFSGLTYRKEFWAAFAGPLTNLFLALLLLPFCIRSQMIIAHYCFYANLILAGVNLLPIFPLDGGRMLSCILSYRFDPAKRDAIMRCLGFILILALLIFAIWQFLISGYNVSLLLICFYLMALLAAQSKGDYS